MPTATPAVAASTSSAVTSGPARSRSRTKAISGSQRGWISAAASSGVPTTSASAAARKPYTGLSTPTWACLARLVTPSFQPASGPAAARSSRCTA